MAAESYNDDTTTDYYPDIITTEAFRTQIRQSSTGIEV